MFVAAATAQNVSFINPGTDFLGDNSNLTYTLGDLVNIQWNSSWTENTLVLLQGPVADGSYALQTLVANASSATTSFVWQAGPIDSTSLAYGFHFFVANGADDTCSGCGVNSVPFRVVQNALASTTSTTSATATPTYTSLSNAPATITATATPSSSSTTASTSRLGLALGVGLGVGVPVLVAIGALAGICLFRRHRRNSNLPRGRHPLSSHSDSPQPMMFAGGVYPQEHKSPYEGPNVTSTRQSGFEPLSFGDNYRASAELHGESLMPVIEPNVERWELSASPAPTGTPSRLPSVFRPRPLFSEVGLSR